MESEPSFPILKDFEDSVGRTSASALDTVSVDLSIGTPEGYGTALIFTNF